MTDQNPTDPTAPTEPTEQIKKANENIEKNIETIKESRIGKAIPRELKNVKQKDLHFIALLIKTILFIPVFMFTFDEEKDPGMGHKLVTYTLYFGILADIVVSFAGFFKFINLPLIARACVPGFKLIMLLIFSIMLAIRHGKALFYMLALTFYLLCVWVEFLHFFYSETKEEQPIIEADDAPKVATEQI